MSNPQIPKNKAAQQTPRQRYRSIMARRQATIYGVLIAVLAIVLAVAMLGLAGTISLPFGNEFTQKEVFAKFGDTPCLPDDARPVGPEGAQVQVLNASSTSGLAASVASELAALGYTEPLVGNTSTFRGNVQIEAGPQGLLHAYTLARYFQKPVRIHLENLAGANVTVILGEGFQDLPKSDELADIAASTAKLTSLPECLNVSEEMTANQPQSQSGDEQSGSQSE